MAKRFNYMVGVLDEKWNFEQEQAQLNKLGERGWELVCILQRRGPKGEPCLYYYLRREKLCAVSIARPAQCPSGGNNS